MKGGNKGPFFILYAEPYFVKIHIFIILISIMTIYLQLQVSTSNGNCQKSHKMPPSLRQLPTPPTAHHTVIMRDSSTAHCSVLAPPGTAVRLSKADWPAAPIGILAFQKMTLLANDTIVLEMWMGSQSKYTYRIYFNILIFTICKYLNVTQSL